MRDLAAPLFDGERIEILTADARRRWRCCATTPPTCWRPRSSICGRGRRSRSAPRSRTASTTTSSSPTASGPSRRGPRADRGADGAPTSRPTSASSARELSAAEAIERFRAEDQPYKVELIEDLIRDEGVETVSLYRNGPFVDLCRGPHGPSTGPDQGVQAELGRRRLLARRREPPDAHPHLRHGLLLEQELEEHLERLEQARSPRPPPPRAPARPLHAPSRGARDAVLAAAGHGAAAADRARGQRAARGGGYVEIKTPHVLDEELWHRSGHWDNYTREHVLHRQVEDGAAFALKPMNCPGACLVYASERRSYRDLPLRLAEFGLVSRNEREGVLHGLLRVRAFTQDDAHVFCTPDQITDEVDSICQAIDELYARFGFDQVRVELSTRPDKSHRHRRAVGAGRGRAARGARAPGPRVRGQPGRGHLLRAEDRLPHHRRTRALLAVRHLPARLPDARALRPLLPGRRQRGAPAGDDPPRPAGLDGALRRNPHRAPRRALPGLARPGAGGDPSRRRPPRRARGRGGRDAAASAGVRCRVDERSESVGKKIHDAEVGKHPYMLVVGDREQERGEVSVRSHAEGDLGSDVRGRVRRARRT